MDFIKDLNEALCYIEEHLTEDIDLNRLGKIAGCSGFHFQRMFSYMADLPLSEYVRRRRMSKAAIDLQNGEKVLDVSLKYGYDSPTAFNRAFQSIHSIAPSLAKSEGITIKAFPPISFKITIKGEAEMNYRIEKKGAFRIVGISEHFPMNMEENFKNIPKLWQRVYNDETLPRLLPLMNGEPYGVLGVCACLDENSMDYYIAVTSDKPAPEGMNELTIPEATWAIFECIGPMPEALQNLSKRIMTEWLPSSGYEYANLPDMEVYSDGDITAEDYRSEIWLPVVKK